MVWKRTGLILVFFLIISACTTTIAPYDSGAFWADATTSLPKLVVTSTPESAVQQAEIVPSPTLQEQPTLTWMPTTMPVVLGLLEFEQGVNPLTGQPVEDPAILNRRPVMIKVSNYPRSGRPHAGLSFADIVFEYYIGEEMNRFLAVFYSQDSPQVGPLRSGRLIDAQLTSMYGGVLVYGSADPKVDTTIINVLHDRALTHNTSPCPPICGQDTHSVSGVFVDSGEMSAYITRKGIDNSAPPLNGLVFDPNPPISDEYSVFVGVEYSFRDRGEWRYDVATGQYLRWIEADDEYNMIQLVDRVNDQPISFSNVVVLYVTYVEYAPTLHDILVWDNDEGNRAILFRDGLAVEGTWIAPNHEQPIQLYNNYGLPMGLKPGTTWFVFLGQSSTMEHPREGSWEFQFDLP